MEGTKEELERFHRMCKALYRMRMKQWREELAARR